MSDIISGSIRGPIEWASVHRPKLKFGSQTDKEYSVNLVVSDPKVRAELEAMLKAHGVDRGVIDKRKNGEAVTPHFTFRRDAVTRSTGQAAVIKVTDSTGKTELTEDIGNGSEAVIHFFLVPTRSALAKGKATVHLSGVQVTKLIPFEKTTSSSGFAPVQGYVAETGGHTLNTDIL